MFRTWLVGFAAMLGIGLTANTAFADGPPVGPGHPDIGPQSAPAYRGRMHYGYRPVYRQRYGYAAGMRGYPVYRSAPVYRAVPVYRSAQVYRSAPVYRRVAVPVYRQTVVPAYRPAPVAQYEAAGYEAASGYESEVGYGTAGYAEAGYAAETDYGYGAEVAAVPPPPVHATASFGFRGISSPFCALFCGCN